MINDKQGVMLVAKDGAARMVSEGDYRHAAARPDGKFLVLDDSREPLAHGWKKAESVPKAEESKLEMWMGRRAPKAVEFVRKKRQIISRKVRESAGAAV